VHNPVTRSLLGKKGEIRRPGTGCVGEREQRCADSEPLSHHPFHCWTSSSHHSFSRSWLSAGGSDSSWQSGNVAESGRNGEYPSFVNVEV